MNKELLENGLNVNNTSEENGYQRYLELSGIISKEDYAGALERAKNATALDKTLVIQAENTAKFAGIELHNTEDSLDPRIVLYVILRGPNPEKPVDDNQPSIKPKSIYFDGVSIDDNAGPQEKPKHPHRQLTDPSLFREVLRMLGDTDALNKMKAAYHTNRPLGTYCPLCQQIRYSEDCP